MLNWTSALYLGMWHAYRSLRPWRQLTTGRPAALVPHPMRQQSPRRNHAGSAGTRAAGGSGWLLPRLHETLHQQGIHTILHRARDDNGARLSLFITALHRRDEIDQTVEVLAQLAASTVQRQLWR